MIPIGADESEPSQSSRMWEPYASAQASAARARGRWRAGLGHTTKAARPTEGCGTDAMRGPAVGAEQQVDVREDAERAKQGGLPGPGGFRAERGRPLHQPARGKAGERMSDGRRHPVRRLL